MSSAMWKFQQAEREVSALLKSAAKLDVNVLSVFPRPVEDIIAAGLYAAVAFECHEGLDSQLVAQVLADSYNIDAREQFNEGQEEELAGFLYATQELVVIFADTQYGKPFEQFTIAHEGGHLVKEYLPLIADPRQGELFTEALPVRIARRDPPENMLAGNSVSGAAEGFVDRITHLKARRDDWRREAIANACAAELLAPFREVQRLIAERRESEELVAELQSRFGLSKKAAHIRLSELGHAKSDPHSLSLFN